MADTVDPADPDDEPAAFHGEEGGDERSSPSKNLGAAVVITGVAVYAMVLALDLDAPSSVYTAPGLLPFLTGATLSVMALFLGYLGIKGGGAADFGARVSRAVAAYVADEEDRRAVMLMALVTLYIVLVGWIDFDLRLPTSFFTFQISSYEAVSIPMMAWILRIFWRAPVWQCALVSLVVIAFLANTFRYAFYILMPAGN